MASPFEELEKKMTSAARVKARKRAKEMMAEMPIHELRRARELSQEHIADNLLKVPQSLKKTWQQ